MRKKPVFSRKLILIGAFLITCAVLFYGGFRRVTRFETSVRKFILTTGLYKPAINKQKTAIHEADYAMELMDLQKRPLKLADLKGKVIFMKFWATWCPPCVAEMPAINSLYKEVANEDIVFLMISKDQHMKNIMKFMNKNKYDLPVYTVDGPVPSVYESRTIPVAFVISPEGEIVYSKTGMVNYNHESFRNFLLNLAKTDTF